MVQRNDKTLCIGIVQFQLLAVFCVHFLISRYARHLFFKVALRINH